MMRWGWAMSDARAPPRDWAVNRQAREEKKWHAPQAGTRRAVWGSSCGALGEGISSVRTRLRRAFVGSRSYLLYSVRRRYS